MKAESMKRILCVSYFSPSEEYAGGQRLLDLYAELKNVQPDLYLALVICGDHGFDIDLLREIFDEVSYLSGKQFSKNNVK